MVGRFEEYKCLLMRGFFDFIERVLAPYGVALKAMLVMFRNDKFGERQGFGPQRNKGT